MKKWIYIIGFFIVFIVAIFTGIVIYNNTQKLNNVTINTTRNEIVQEHSLKNDITVEVATDKEKISPNASLVLKKHYKECDHTIKEYAEIPEEFVNLTIEELKGEYKNWEIEEFSPTNVILIKEEDGVCGEHYILKEENGVIVVYKIEEDGKETLIEETGIYTEYLTENDKMNIANGIEVYGKEELNSTIEDFE